MNKNTYTEIADENTNAQIAEAENEMTEQEKRTSEFYRKKWLHDL